MEIWAIRKKENLYKALSDVKKFFLSYDVTMTRTKLKSVHTKSCYRRSANYVALNSCVDIYNFLEIISNINHPRK